MAILSGASSNPALESVLPGGATYTTAFQRSVARRLNFRCQPANRRAYRKVVPERSVPRSLRSGLLVHSSGVHSMCPSTAFRSLLHALPPPPATVVVWRPPRGPQLLTPLQ